MEGYTELRRRRPQTPLFFGVGNVTELIDADSAGANALLAAVGAEVSASILFTPEYSEKARGSVRELKIASEMMLLAKERRTPPKDLGLDLLVLKEKRRKAPPTSLKPQRTLEASCDHAWHEDPAGNFEILLDGGRILVRGCGAQLEGISARDILNTLIDLGMVTRLDHVGYLGRELEKAEIALALGRSYVQDEPLFPGKVLK
jgi:dihydropteroate synthase-like protein